MTTPTAIPGATYRLQLNSSFTFADAAATIPYLDSLGVTDCYLSPILAAQPGSLHGYDVTDPSRLNPELGGLESFLDLGRTLARHGMRIVLDIVPNHMCISDPGNLWWQDVLENGPSSPHARYFDIDWRPPREDLENKILLPVLGDQYGRVLESGLIRLAHRPGSFFLSVYDRQYPVAPRTWSTVLAPALAQVKADGVVSGEDLMEFESIVTALSYLPPRTETDEAKVRERQREKEVIRRRMKVIEDRNELIRRAIETAVDRINGRPGDSFSFNALEQFLASQPFRLSFWRVAADEINYRRFFDINDLAAVRVEDPPVFSAVHERILELIRGGWIRGLRVDHADGLYDPVQYFMDLQQACEGALRSVDAGASEGGAGTAKPFYIIAEKVLVGDETLRPDWVIYGTTGYGYMNQLNGLFVDPDQRQALLKVYHGFTGTPRTFRDVVYESKRLILRFAMSSEFNVLARRLDRVCQQHRHSRDFTLESLRFALLEVISCFPVYRTYIRPGMTKLDQQDQRHIRAAIREAADRNPAAGEDVFALIGSVLLLEDPPGLTERQVRARRRFVFRFQQLTGPVMAKGLEDTAFYRHFPLASLNEVGGDPEVFGLRPESFHEAVRSRAERWPHGMLATSTHDTKRSEDVRARINVLSEIPALWHDAIRRWHIMLRNRRIRIGSTEVPGKNTEYFLFQTLIGAWPIGTLDAAGHRAFVRRIQDYMEKATNEAKVHTSWINPRRDYDDALRRFIEACLDTDAPNRFLEDFLEFVRPVVFAGMMNSLSQTLLKIAGPGVPDIYQGNEMWRFSLVDPDNRRPVNYELRRTALAGLDAAETKDRDALLRGLFANPQDGRLKLFVTSRALRFRRASKDLFSYGSYDPVPAQGERAAHAVAFRRRTDSETAVAAVGRLFYRLGAPDRPPVGECWGDTWLVLGEALEAQSAYEDALTGMHHQPEVRDGKAVLPLKSVFRALPVALLRAMNPAAVKP